MQKFLSALVVVVLLLISPASVFAQDVSASDVPSAVIGSSHYSGTVTLDVTHLFLTQKGKDAYNAQYGSGAGLQSRMIVNVSGMVKDDVVEIDCGVNTNAKLVGLGGPVDAPDYTTIVSHDTGDIEHHKYYTITWKADMPDNTTWDFDCGVTGEPYIIFAPTINARVTVVGANLELTVSRIAYNRLFFLNLPIVTRAWSGRSSEQSSEASESQ